MTWYEITIAVASALGGFELIKWLYGVIFNRKNNTRIADTKATNAEIEVEKNKAIAEAEAKKALEEAHAVERKQYEERIADLHRTIDKLNEQLDGYVERDAAKENRFEEQTQLFRKERSERLALEKEKAEMEVKYLKQIAALELELEKVRCNEYDCPFRQPPTAYTPPAKGLVKEDYFAKKRATETTE